MKPIHKPKTRFAADHAPFRKGIKGAIVILLLSLGGGFIPAGDAGADLCPPEFGKIVCEFNPSPGKRLFIIGMGHRDSLTGTDGPRTARIQAEVYKLGEWLIREEGLELILPEGFFKNEKTPENRSAATPDRERKRPAEPLDLKTLEAKLADKTAFVNAEILLKRNYPIVLQQVEDKGCYEEVGAVMGKLFGGSCPPEEYGPTRAKLDFLQEKRTAGMLQKIPEIVSREYAQGRIKTRKAIFTIGLSHLPAIIKYFKEGGIRLPASFAADSGVEELKLLREGFRVSILVPRTLAGEPALSEINGSSPIGFAPYSPKESAPSRKNRER
jgi:hypothetical protein